MQSYPTPSELLEQYPRFWLKVTFPDDLTQCWLWHGTKSGKNYGIFCPITSQKKRVMAHRFAYEFIIGAIPKGLTLDHLCRVHPCCNPSHLEPVTSAVNVMRGFGPCAQNARKIHCPLGHIYDKENTYYYPVTNHRMSRECHRIHLRAANARRKRKGSPR